MATICIFWLTRCGTQSLRKFLRPCPTGNQLTNLRKARNVHSGEAIAWRRIRYGEKGSMSADPPAYHDVIARQAPRNIADPAAVDCVKRIFTGDDPTAPITGVPNPKISPRRHTLSGGRAWRHRSPARRSALRGQNGGGRHDRLQMSAKITAGGGPKGSLRPLSAPT